MQDKAIAAPKKPGFFDWRSEMGETQPPGRDQKWHQNHIQNKIGYSNPAYPGQSEYIFLSFGLCIQDSVFEVIQDTSSRSI